MITTPYTEEDVNHGEHRLSVHNAPIGYDHDGQLRRIEADWKSSGDLERPHMITKSRLMTSVGDDGMRRIHPTREKDKYIEVGAPYVKPAGAWVKMPFSGAVRSANRITWSRAEADLSIVHAGHYLKLDLALKDGYIPPNGQFGFPVGLQGLTRQGNKILDGDRVVMTLRAPVAFDAASPWDVRPIKSEFAWLDGRAYILFALPSLSGMTRPVVDPMLALQPDGTTGYDTAIIGPPQDSMNFGSITDCYIGQQTGGALTGRCLIKFDLDQLPSTAIVTEATPSLYARSDFSSNDRTLKFFRLKRNWVEMQATWNVFSTGNNWQTPGAFGADDCEQTEIGSRLFTATEALGWKTFSLAGNSKSALDLGYGWLLKMDTEIEDMYQFALSDNITSSIRPKLDVVYRLLNSLIVVK